jgi:purine-binding chemotaxis protein CheW
MEEEKILVGILVDSVREVLELKNSEIAPSPSIGTKYNSGFIEGLWRTDNKFIMILDINRVFSIDEVIDFKEHLDQVVN